MHQATAVRRLNCSLTLPIGLHALRQILPERLAVGVIIRAFLVAELHLKQGVFLPIDLHAGDTLLGSGLDISAADCEWQIAGPHTNLLIYAAAAALVTELQAVQSPVNGDVRLDVYNWSISIAKA